MKKVAWISPMIPYDNVGHASGKTQNYYIKRLIESNEFDLRLISFYWPSELNNFTLDKNIKCSLHCYYDSGIKKILRNILDFEAFKNPFNKYANLTSKYIELCVFKTLKEYKSEGFIPDTVILQWTQVVLFANKIKQLIPGVRVIGIEEDVSLLSYQRRIRLAKNNFQRGLAEIRFHNIEKEEIKALNNCDVVILNNKKDYKLLEKYSIKSDIKIWSVYYDIPDKEIPLNENARDIVFYGAMGRQENNQTAKWLLDKVAPLLTDLDVRFVMVGGNPPEWLKDYASEKIIITGFVDDVNEYFRNALCMAAPLVLGAGIKVKILEAFASGVTVLTNEIGIEGIPMSNEEDYFFCNTPEEYADVIRMLYSSMKNRGRIRKNGRERVLTIFDYKSDGDRFIEWI